MLLWYAKHSAMPKGNFPRSEQHRANISKAMKGRKHSPEHVENQRISQTGRKLSPEHVEKLKPILARGRQNRVFLPERHHIRSAAHMMKSTSLRKYGISLEEYQRQRKAGFRWCHWAKHWREAGEFKNKMVICNACLPEYSRAMNLRRLFGVDQAWYQAKLAEQDGVCAICQSPEPQNMGMRFLAIDHDHNTDHIRGLLCSKCNNALERLDLYPGWAERAIAYVLRYRKLASDGLLPKAPKPFRRYIRPARRKLQNYVPVRGVEIEQVTQ